MCEIFAFIKTLLLSNASTCIMYVYVEKLDKETRMWGREHKRRWDLSRMNVEKNKYEEK